MGLQLMSFVEQHTGLEPRQQSAVGYALMGLGLLLMQFGDPAGGMAIDPLTLVFATGCAAMAVVEWYDLNPYLDSPLSTPLIELSIGITATLLGLGELVAIALL